MSSSSCGDHMFILMMILIMFILTMISISMVEGQPQVPCYFIFGDSVVDNGNNNDLITTAKANYFPYGIDFPTGPQNGRFTNGRTKVDFIAELIGFDTFIPPFATARGNEILKGVNYGSGVAGIRDETGYRWGDRISMNRQLLNHKLTILRINSILRNVTAARSLLNKCLYTIDMGNNDYLNNYLEPRFYPSSLLYTPDEFARVLVQQFGTQLRSLHEFGARKVAVSNIGLLGCLPEETRRFRKSPASGCLTVFDSPCCIVSNTTSKGQCVEGQIPCNNRNQYVFFDNFHPTEVANMATARRSYNALLPSDAYPTDISRLIQS
ncbi:hypothetical protein HAX54_012986 [Datura stramonium]|uniref:Uncharacterized protein n=1 Tax=Datura stramonium TaxID=4076 RepID=A0ABS8RXW2_DATST|nr:hypothetical protein [Datura stramonium]